MIRKLRIKFVCTNMLIVFVMLGIIFATVLAATHRELEENAVTFMREIAFDPMRMIRPGDTVPGGQFPFFSVEIDNSGQVVAANGGYYALDDAEILDTIADRSAAETQPSGYLSEYNLRYYRLVTPTSQRIVFADTSGEQGAMNAMLRICLLIGLGSMVVFFFISLALSRWAIRPVELAWKQQKQFVSDASHELKTPLSLIALNAEMLDCDMGTVAAETSRRNILQGIERMRALVEQLLILARTDGGLLHKQMKPLDLSSLVVTTALSAEALFLETNQTLTVETDPDICICGSASHLEQLLTIFLDNARKYGAAGGAVTVSLKRCAVGACQLCVCNTGEPIPKDKLGQIFERFCRLDEARAADGSCGLGLSIAANIAKEHGGKIWAESGCGENRFYVRFPMKRKKIG